TSCLVSCPRRCRNGGGRLQETTTLAQRTLAGATSIFQFLVQRHRPRLVRVAARLAGDAHETPTLGSPRLTPDLARHAGDRLLGRLLARPRASLVVAAPLAEPVMDSVEAGLLAGPAARPRPNRRRTDDGWAWPRCPVGRPHTRRPNPHAAGDRHAADHVARR